MATLNIGDEVPDFELPAVTGNIKSQFKLSDYRGKKNVVLAFYPADWTPVCASQLPAMNTDLSASAHTTHKWWASAWTPFPATPRGRRKKSASWAFLWPAIFIPTARWRKVRGSCAKAIPSRGSTSVPSSSSIRTGSSRSARFIPSGKFPATMISSRPCGSLVVCLTSQRLHAIKMRRARALLYSIAALPKIGYIPGCGVMDPKIPCLSPNGPAVKNSVSVGPPEPPLPKVRAPQAVDLHRQIVHVQHVADPSARAGVEAP